MGYKEEHEAFVSGLAGSSIWMVIYIGCNLVLINAIRSSLDVPGSFVTSFLLDVLFLLLPSLCLLSYPETLGLWISISFLFIFLLQVFVTKSSRVTRTKSMKLPYLTLYRSSLLLITCLAILAVDFRIFPRFFAKTETFGYSLMDAGVGSFVFSNAIVSKSARVMRTGKSPSLWVRMKAVLGSVSPLLVLGFIRLYTTKAADYQEHVSEYGVHWNFFFTLSAVAMLVTLFDIPSVYCPWVASIIIILYQGILFAGVEDWIINSPRDNLISMNKEGICSSIGFFCICLYGTWIGGLLFANQSSKVSQDSALLKKLLTWDIIFWVLCFLCDFYIPASRRMSNITYTLFIVAYNLLLVILFQQVEKWTKPISSVLMDGLGRNGLFMFLLANLLTGATNLSIQTLYVADGAAFGILFAYLLAVSISAVVLHRLEITLKFW